jgi:hypothetical protein
MLEFRNLTVRHPKTNARKQAEREIRDPPSTLETLKVLHQGARLCGGKCGRYSPSAPDSVMRQL